MLCLSWTIDCFFFFSFLTTGITPSDTSFLKDGLLCRGKVLWAFS